MPGNRAAPRPTRAAAAQQGTPNEEEGTNTPNDATPTQLDESTTTGDPTNEGNEQANAQSRDEVAAQAIYAVSKVAKPESPQSSAHPHRHWLTHNVTHRRSLCLASQAKR